MLVRVAAFIVGLVGAVAAASAQDDPLRIGLTVTSQSFSATDTSGGLSGFNLEIVNELCRRLHRRCELKETSFRDMIPAVSGGAVDIGVGNMLKSPERARQVAFTIPYWRSTSSFVGKAGKPLPHLSALLTDHKVCAIADSRQDLFLRGLPGAGDKSIAAFKNVNETLIGLRDGVCEFALAPTIQALSFLKSPEGGKFAFRGLPMLDDGLGGDVHMVVGLNRPDLLKEVDGALAAMIRDGVHERISRRFFPFSIL